MKVPTRFHLAHLPTPLEPMERLSETLGGPRLWIKRDDQTGLATGGNKTRKLEYLMADALDQEADVAPRPLDRQSPAGRPARGAHLVGRGPRSPVHTGSRLRSGASRRAETLRHPPWRLQRGGGLGLRPGL